MFGTDDTYAYVLLALWAHDPVVALRQAAAIVIVWSHACIGLHYWLRLKSWYGRVHPYLYAVALLLPVFSLLGFVSAGRTVAALNDEPGWREALLAEVNAPALEDLAILLTVERWTLIGLGTVLVLVLAAREMRHRLESRRHQVRVRYPGGREVRIAPGTTILEASRANGIPHASICGGRSRCSTCRVRVNEGQYTLPPPSPEERRVLDRIGVPPDVRLACQLRPSAPVSVTPLLPPNVGPAEGLRAATAMQGEERTITVLFADIRGFTGLAETKLPYDVVFVLNRYFRSMGEAIEHAGGRVDKFIGDGIMALFGIDTTPAAGAAQALAAAKGMAEALRDLNRLLESESSGAASHRYGHPHRARHRRRDGLRHGGLRDRDRRYGEHREPARVDVEGVRGAARRLGRGCVRGRRGPHGMARGGGGGARAPGAARRLHRRRRRRATRAGRLALPVPHNCSLG